MNGGQVEIGADAVPPKPRFKREYLGLWARRNDPLEHEMHDIHSYFRGNREMVEPMGSEKRNYPGFDDLYFLPGQLAVLPLLDHEQVSTETVIGSKRSLHGLDVDDLATTNYEISHHTPVSHV